MLRRLSSAKNSLYSRRLPGFLQPFLRRFVKPYLSPKVVMVAVTYHCQARCQHCMVHNYIKPGIKELSFDEIALIVDQAAEIRAQAVYFFGGEPLVRTDFVDMVRYANKRGLMVRFDTNGALIDASLAQRLKDAGNLYIVGVSLDSPDAVAHDAHRGMPGSFDGVVTAIRHLKAAGIPVHISYFITRTALQSGDLPRVIQLGRELGVDGIRVMSPIPCGRLHRSPDMEFTSEDEKLLRGLLEPGFVYMEQENITRDYRCPAFDKSYIYISPYGEVQPCCFVPVSFGNVREEPLERLIIRMWTHWMFGGDNTVCLGCSLPRSHKEALEKGQGLPLDYRDLEEPRCCLPGRARADEESG